MNDIDLAYAAGLIDGEGSISITKQKGKYHDGYMYRLFLQIGMCDVIAPTWMYDTFGGSCNFYDRPETAYRRVHRWQLNDRRAADLLVMLLPHLKTKKSQTEIAIEFQKGKKPAHLYPNNTKPLILKEAEAILAEKVSKLNRGIKS